MRYLKWIGLASAIILIMSCFIPWIFIESKSITVSGIDARGTNFGKPGYFHFAMAVFFLFFSLMPKVWAKRANLLITALNMGWALRNFIIIGACEGGECPLKKGGIWLILASSAIMLVSSLFPDMKLQHKQNQSPGN